MPSQNSQNSHAPAMQCRVRASPFAKVAPVVAPQRASSALPKGHTFPTSFVPAALAPVVQGGVRTVQSHSLVPSHSRAALSAKEVAVKVANIAARRSAHSPSPGNASPAVQCRCSRAPPGKGDNVAAVLRSLPTPVRSEVPQLRTRQYQDSECSRTPCVPLVVAPMPASTMHVKTNNSELAGAPTATPLSSDVLSGDSGALTTGTLDGDSRRPHSSQAAVEERFLEQEVKAVEARQERLHSANAKVVSRAGYPEMCHPPAVVQPSGLRSQSPHSMRPAFPPRKAQLQEPTVKDSIASRQIESYAPMQTRATQPAAPRRRASQGTTPANAVCDVQVASLDVCSASAQGSADDIKDANGTQQTTPREHLERELEPGEKISYNDLHLIECLGSGEFGQVYRGLLHGEEVAIKALYRDSFTMSECVMQDFAKEIESFRHLKHKRLVRFIGACLDGPNPCLVTEYMPGGSLHHLLHVRKLRLPLLHAINMCLQLADGVMYIHSQSPTIVHRDLKSLNVVLDLNLNLKICDFGLTESMDGTHIAKRNNGGSPRYMAPELFDARSKITEKIDVWAMGCIYGEVFGGPLPYEHINNLADLTKEMLVRRQTPSIPSVSTNLQSIIRSCLCFDYAVRPSSKQVYANLKAAKKQLREEGRL